MPTVSPEKKGLASELMAVSHFSLTNKHLEIEIEDWRNNVFLIFPYSMGKVDFFAICLNTFQHNSWIRKLGNGVNISVYEKDNKFYIQGDSNSNHNFNIDILCVSQTSVVFTLNDGLFDTSNATFITSL